MSISQLIALVLALFSAYHGWASQYGSNTVTDVTLEARQGWGHLPEDVSMYDGFVATESCDHIGKEMYLYREGIGLEFFAVFDCSGHASTTRWMKANNILVEIDHRTAVRWDVVGEGGVEILMIPCWEQPEFCKMMQRNERDGEVPIERDSKYTPI